MKTAHRANYHFKNAKVEYKEVKAGYTVGLPVRYYDFEVFMLLYTAPYKNVEKLMPSSRIKPVSLWPGKAGVMLCAYKYKDIADVEPYNEWSINIPVQYGAKSLIPLLPAIQPEWFKNAGSYVHVMPVTTEEVVHLGIDLYGFPLSLGDISYETDGDRLASTFNDNGTRVITMTMKKIPTKRMHMKNVVNTVQDGMFNKFTFEFVGNIGIKVFPAKKLAASYTLGNHPIADEIRGLQLAKNPIMLVYSDHIEGLMHPPASSDHRLPL
jgi:acetoacetate decarboxylase